MIIDETCYFCALVGEKNTSEIVATYDREDGIICVCADCDAGVCAHGYDARDCEICDEGGGARRLDLPNSFSRLEWYAVSGKPVAVPSTSNSLALALAVAIQHHNTGRN